MISGKVCLSFLDHNYSAELSLVANTHRAVCATTAELEIPIPEVILRPSISTNLLSRKYILNLSMQITELVGSVTYYSRGEIPIAILACHQQSSDECQPDLQNREVEQQLNGPPPAYVP
jgi:hypothetical protein